MAEGPWDERVRFSADGSAYVPDVVVLAAESQKEANRARELLRSGYETEVDIGEPEPVIDGWYRLRGDFDPQEAAARLIENGFTAQVVHAFFSHSMEGAPLFGSPLFGSPLFGSPLFGSPLFGSPLFGSPLFGSPLFGSPLFGSPLFGSPLFGSSAPSPVALPHTRLGGRRRSSALPQTPTGRLEPPPVPAKHQPRVAILDTGWIPKAEAGLAGMAPPEVVDMTKVPGIVMPVSPVDQPDSNGDGQLDPATGHATFIAGIIEQIAPRCRITIVPVLTEYGDGREDDIAIALESLAKRKPNRRPHVVNLSFGAYLFDPPGKKGLGAIELLRTAVKRLQDKGVVVVASAGNDGSFAPTYPAAFDDVISVGAVDAHGLPAAFSNYGGWVRTCTLGVDVVSLFFDGFPIADNVFHQHHPLAYQGWARWSGTSFAAPRVVGAVARRIGAGLMAQVPAPDNANAARVLIDAIVGPANSPDRLPMLGTLIVGE